MEWLWSPDAASALWLPLVATLTGVFLAELLAMWNRRRLERQDAEAGKQEENRLTARSYGLLAAAIQANDPKLARVHHFVKLHEWLTPFTLDSQSWANVGSTLLVNDRENYLLHARLDAYFARAASITTAIGAYEATLRAFTGATGGGLRPYNDLLEALRQQVDLMVKESGDLKKAGLDLLEDLKPLVAGSKQSGAGFSASLLRRQAV